MSIGFDPGDGGGTGLPAADQGTLDWLNGLTVGQQQPQPDYGLTPQSGAEDYGNYAPYAGAPPTQGQGYSDYVDAGSQPNPYINNTEPDFSSGVSAPDQTQPNFYLDQTPSLPSFSSGVTDEWGGHDPGQATYTSGLVDEWGGNDPGQRHDAWQEDPSLASENYVAPPQADTSPWTARQDNYRGEGSFTSGVRPTPNYTFDPNHGQYDADLWNNSARMADNTIDGSKVFGVADRHVATPNGVVSWDPNARDVNDPIIRRFLNGDLDDTELLRYRHQIDAWLKSGALAEVRNHDYTQGVQPALGAAYTNAFDQQAANRAYFTQAAQNTQQQVQRASQQAALETEWDRQIGALKNVNPYDQPEQYGVQGTQQYGGAYAPDYTRQTGTASAGETFDTLLAIVNRGYGFEAAVKQYGLTPAEAAQIGLAASITDPARLARTRQLWIDAHIGTQFDSPTPQYTNSWNISPRDVALGVTGLRTAADVIAPNQTPMQRVGQVGKAIERAFAGVGIATQFATTLADNTVYLVQQAVTGQPVVDGDHPGPASAASAKYLQTVDDIKQWLVADFIKSYYGPGGMLPYGGNATLDTPEKVAAEAARFRQENPALDMALDQGIQIALGELGAIGARTVAAGVRGYRAPIDIPAPARPAELPVRPVSDLYGPAAPVRAYGQPPLSPELGALRDTRSADELLATLRNQRNVVSSPSSVQAPEGVINARPETPGATGRPGLVGEGDNPGGLPPLVAEPRAAGLADPANPVAPSVDVPRPAPALDRPVVGDQSLPPATAPEPVAPPARPTGRTAIEPSPVVSSFPDVPIASPRASQAFDAFINDPAARKDPYIPSVEYIARNIGASPEEVNALIRGAIDDGRLRVITTRSGSDIAFAPRTTPKPAINVPELYNTQPVATATPAVPAGSFTRNGRPSKWTTEEQAIFSRDPAVRELERVIAEVKAGRDTGVESVGIYGNAVSAKDRELRGLGFKLSAARKEALQRAAEVVPNAPVASLPAGSFTRNEVSKLTSTAYYDQPKAIGNATRAHPDPQARAARAIERINADPKLAAKLRERDPALADRVLNAPVGEVARIKAQDAGQTSLFDTKPTKPLNPNLTKFMEDAHPLLKNEDGTPKVLYHGTQAGNFDQFAIPQESGNWGRGVYLAEDADVAGQYAGKLGQDSYGANNPTVAGDAGPNIKPVYAALKKPFIVADHPPLNLPVEQIAPTLQARGYDGVIVTMDAYQPDLPRIVQEVVAFDSKSIKSATGNRGTYDPNNSMMLYSIGPTGAKAIARGAIGGLAGYAAPASDEEDRWRHALLGATLGVGIGGVNKVVPYIDRKAGAYLYGTADRGAAEAFWKGTAKDLPDLGAGRKGKAGIFAAQKNAQRVIVGDRVSSAVYAALDAELKDAGLTTLAPTANKRATETILKNLINNPSAHNLTGVFEGTLGGQLKNFFATHDTALSDAVRGILSEPVPGGLPLTPDVIAKRFGTVTSAILADPAEIGVTRGATWKTDPLLKLNQSIVRELAPVWMTLNPRYHINNAMGNLAGSIADILAHPDTGLVNGAKAGKAARAGDIGSGVRYSNYASADLTGSPTQRGGALSRIPGIGKVIDKAGDAANAVEKAFKDDIIDRNRTGYHSANMRFQFGQEGLGDIAPTLFSDHFGGQTPQLTGIPKSVQESLRGVVDANEAQRIVNSARMAGTLTPQQAGVTMKTFRTSLYQAEKYADDAATWAMRDYRIRSNGDWLLDHVTPLHFWTTHNILATARLAAKNPALIAPIAAGLLWWQHQNQDLPDSLKWTIEVPYKQMIKVLPQDVQDEIISNVDNIYGQNADIRLRPWNWINPAIGAAAQTLTPEQAQGHSAAMSMPQLITGWMEKFGYNPSPAWDAMGTALRRIPEVAGFKPIIVAGLNNKDYFNPSIAGQWGSWTRAATMFMANNADASLAPDNAARGMADLLREVPYKFNSIVYGDRYSQYEHEAIAKLIANQERLGKITHDQALNALKNGEKDGVFLAARQEFTDQAAGRGGVSWAGAPVSGRNDYQRSVTDINNQYFADGATKPDKKALIANNQWITTDWAKKDSPDEIGRAQELNALWDQYNALPPGKQRSAIYAQIQALTPAGGTTTPAGGTLAPSPSTSAKPTASTPTTANVGKGLATGFRAADVSNEFLADENKPKSQALWDEYDRLKAEDQAAKDKTGKSPGLANAFFAAHADEFNAYDTHRTLKPFAAATTASGTTPTAIKPAVGIGKGLATGFRAADVSNEYLTDVDKAKSDKLWAEYDRLKAVDQATYDKTGKNPGNAAAFRKANAAEFNRLDVHRTLEPTFYPSGSVLPAGTTTVVAKPATGGGTTSTPAKAPVAAATTRTPSASASAPRMTTVRKASTAPIPAKSAAPVGPKTSTSLPSSSPYATPTKQNRSPGNPTTGVPFSEGVSQWTDAQRNARPFVSSAQPAATNSPASTGKAGNTAPVTPTGIVPDKPFSASAYQYAVKQYTANPNSNSLNTIFGMLRKLDGQGKDITPYAWQVVRDLERSIVPRIKTYQGPDRASGDRIRGQMLAAIKQITPDLDGLQLLMEIQGALG